MEINEYITIECDRFLDRIKCKYTKGRYYIKKALQITVKDPYELTYMEGIYYKISNVPWRRIERCIRYAIASTEWAGMCNKDFLQKATAHIRKIIAEKY
jgi:hypothetical protein